MVRIPDPVWKKSGSGMNIPDNFSESFETIFWVKILKFIDTDPESGIFLILYPGSGMEKLGSGIRDKQPGSATLLFSLFYSEIESQDFFIYTVVHVHQQNCVVSVHLSAFCDTDLIFCKFSYFTYI